MRVSGTLKMELQMVMNQPVGAGKHTQIFGKSS